MKDLTNIMPATSLAEIRDVATKKAEDDLAFLKAAEILINIKRLETFLEQYKQSVRKIGLEELERTTEFNGFLITKGETVKYDYSQDPLWNELKADEERVANKRKAREAYLKAVKEPIVEVNEETGEVTKIYPPTRYVSDRITISEVFGKTV